MVYGVVVKWLGCACGCQLVEWGSVQMRLCDGAGVNAVRTRTGRVCVCGRGLVAVEMRAWELRVLVVRLVSEN